MAPTVEDLAKALASSSPPERPTSPFEQQRLGDIRPFFDPKAASNLLGIASLEESRKAIIGNPYASVAGAANAFKPSTLSDVLAQNRQTTLIGLGVGLDAFKPSPIAEVLGDGWRPAQTPTAFQRTVLDGAALLGRAVEATNPLAQGVVRAVEELAPWARVLGDLTERLIGAFRPVRPTDPYGQPVPLHNARLYLTARRAYEGDFEARALFLDAIGADESPDNVLYIEQLLKPTFDPNRLDRRVPWERRSSDKARAWLRERLTDIKLEDGREECVPLLYEEERHAAVGGIEVVNFMEAEMERSRRAEIRGILPEQQYQVLMLLAEGHKQADIAEKLGIGISTVKTHARRLRQNPDLLRMVRS